MADYTAPTDAQLAVDSPVRSLDMRNIRDLTQATAEGAVGAPRMYLGFLERVSAGTEIRWNNVSGYNTSSTSNTTAFEFGINQDGTVSIEDTHYAASTAVCYVIVQRIRAGTATDFLSFSASTSTVRSGDIDVIAGDNLKFVFRTGNA